MAPVLTVRQINLYCDKQTTEDMAVASHSPTCLFNNMHFAYRANKQKPLSKNKSQVCVSLICSSTASETNIAVTWRESQLGFWYCDYSSAVWTKKHIQFIQQRLTFSCLFLSAAALSASCSYDQHPQLSEAYMHNLSYKDMRTARAQTDTLSSVCAHARVRAHTNRLWYSGSISQIISPHWVEIHFPHVIFRISQGHLQLIQSL